MKLDQKFEEWVRKKHMLNCSQCQKEGKSRLMDNEAVAVNLFKEFYNQKK